MEDSWIRPLVFRLYIAREAGSTIGPGDIEGRGRRIGDAGLTSSVLGGTNKHLDAYMLVSWRHCDTKGNSLTYWLQMSAI